MSDIPEDPSVPAPARRVAVWDVPIRVFHWTLVVSVVALIATGKVGGNALEWHKKIGYLVLGLVGFRLVWGVVGGHHARFVNFVRGPATVLAYLRGLAGKAPAHLGHNPMGALSVLAMLALIGFQAASGLFADDDIMMKGPYADAVSSSVSTLMTRLHKWNANLIMALIGVHLAAIAFYFFVKKDNLVRPMLTGSKVVTDAPVADKPVGEGETAETARPAWVFWVVAVCVGIVTALIVTRAFG